jgi:xylulokinase
MGNDYVLAVDCSTTAAKAVVWNDRGEALSEGRQPFDLRQPRPGWGEQDAEDWWTSTVAAVRRAVGGVDPSRIKAFAVTHQRESFVCLDEAGAPLRPAMLWLDVRATAQVEAYGNEHVHKTTGKPPNPTPAWYKLLWLAEHEPETIERVGTVADVHAFLVHRLTGRRVTSWASADPLGLVDMTTFDYDEGLLAAVGLNRAQVPETCAPATVIGELGEEAARLTGLPAAVPVVAGAGDGQCAQLGSGVTTPGRVSLNLGSGVVSGAHSDSYLYGRAFRTMAAAVPGAYSLETFMGGGTIILNWFVSKFAGFDPREAGLEITPEQVLEVAAADLPPGADGLLVLPYWTGSLTPYWDHNARGILLGLSGIHSKAHLYRAVLEGIAFEQRLLTDGAEAAMGTPITEVVTLGGGSRSAMWCQLIADVMRRPVSVVAQPESTCLGAGMLAAAAVGIHASVPAAAAAMSGTVQRYEPRSEASATYDRLFDVYRDVYPANRELFARLSGAG